MRALVQVRDGLVSVVLPLLLGRRGVLLQVLTRERVEVVHDIQVRTTTNRDAGLLPITQPTSYGKPSDGCVRGDTIGRRTVHDLPVCELG